MLHRPAFRIRPYAHSKYRFVVRAKIGGKWKRRYFTSEAQAVAFATQQNRSLTNGPPPASIPGEDAAGPLELCHPNPTVNSRNELLQAVTPVYRGPRIERYFGDHWSMHLPFAFDLMRELRPRVFVELGVWKGESYFAFCQSAAENNVAVKCYGVDSWRGDVHMGRLDAQLRKEVEQYNHLYADFSILKAKTFDEAVGDFADESIDLLHIDGAHTYEDVHRDFESWLPKLSPSGVVLFHDVAVHGRGFGVWKLWQQIAVPGSSFVFEFGYGLGVWKMTNTTPPASAFLRKLFQADEEQRNLINERYAMAASALASWESQHAANDRVEALQPALSAAREQATEVERLRRALANEAQRLRLEVTRLQNALEEGQVRADRASKELEAAQAREGAHRARIERDAESLRAREAEITKVRARIATSRRRNEQVRAELQNERARGAELLRHLEEQQQADEQATKAIEERWGEIRRLRTVVEVWKSRSQGERAYTTREEERREDLCSDLFQTGRALRQGGPALPGIFDLIWADIERIRRPRFWWKAIKSVGLLRRAAPGCLTTAADRRAVAAKLGASLREIEKTLSSKVAAPEESVSAIRALFELRRHARSVVDSLRFSRIFSRNPPPGSFVPRPRRFGGRSLRSHPASVLFDAAWYLGEYPDVAAAEMDPLTHYLERGAAENRNPNPIFDTAWYLARNPDVALADLNPLEHYLVSGAREGRDPSPLFSTSWYLKQNPDVAATGINPLQHYLEHGIRERRNPHPLFAVAYYLTQAREAEGTNPVEHYLKAGAWDVSPHPLFDVKWYLQQNPRARTNKVAPLLHYLDIGGLEENDPHPLFDSSWYLDRNPDIRAKRLNPLIHYLETGSREGRDPHPLFDSSWYRSRRTDLLSAGCDPLTHYLTRGVEENTNPNPLFETSWYLAENRDVGAAGMNPLAHFNLAGGFEGRDPHPLFDSSWYLEQNPDVRESGINPLSHYLLEGALQGRDPHPLFQSKYYEEQRRALQFSAADLQTGPRPTAAFVRPRTNGAESVVYAFTSICLNYVPKAIVLARTLKEHNPAIRFCVLVNDRIPEGALDPIDVFDEVIPIDALDIANKPSWIFRHTVVELCTAVKGYFMVDLLDRKDCAAAFYFDPDIVCFSALDVLTDKLAKASILLTPHLTDPEITNEAILDNEICALKHGVYNLGFLGLRPSPEGRRFARWWRERLRDFCRADIAGGLFTDQRWVDLAPALFQEVDIVRHPGCNAATWNLTNRNIEGDFTSGFTVNGEPLIFYHFSGFDSGAQGAMLDKYGGEMPAAQLLRKWYIQETTKSGDAHFSQLPWTLGSFSNGEPISDAQRILYRDRVDVQKAFPNPFEASAPKGSYYHWYHSEVLGRPIAHDGGGYNPLIEFIQAKSSLSPNPYFHSAWYLQQNPDVAAAGINPLLHFVVSGAEEGRRPNPDFYPAYYRRELPPNKRPENPLTHYVLRGRKENRRTDPRYHPIADAPLRDRIRIWAGSGPPLILLVSHYGGGGTEKHLRDLTESAQNKAKFIRLIPGHDGFVRLVTSQDDLSVTLTFDPADQFQELVEVLQQCDPQRVHIHHILGNEEYLAALVRELKRPFDFTIHDYYVLAPSPHLIGPDARYVGDDLDAHEDELLAASIAPRKPSSLVKWQHAHSWLVTEADRVIAPSHDVASRFSRFFPLLDPIVAAHPEANPAPRKVMVPAVTSDTTFRVAVLGDLLPHKGKDIILACATVARARGYKVSFELIGDPHGDASLLDKAGIWVSGRYDEGHVHALLKQRRPHLIWYPALCPETFSYTLSIGLESGIPLVVTDLGSLPERVAGQPWTWIRPWQFEASDWLTFFLRIREENFLSRVAPKTEAEPIRATSRFYYTNYLAVLKDDQTKIERLRGVDLPLTVAH